jgi:RNA polymerase sigma-54 factor
MPVTPAEHMIGRQLIEFVDEAGYLVEDIETLAAQLGVEPDTVGAMLTRMQGCDPTGVFARSLRECLALQLAEHGELDAKLATFLDNLPLIARHDIAGLMRACHATRDEIAAMATRIRRLNPKPGLQFGAEAVQPVVPDVLVRTAPDGSWIVELNAETLPRVLVDQTYYATVARGAKGAEDKTYLSECLANANWLVKSLDQRARTILKVSREIVRQQDAFLLHGVQHLRPLNLKTVANAIEMHESTVSRVTANKYMMTSRGIFELKYFFTSAIPASGGGDSVSAEAVRHRIREMIENEAATEILSDDRLVELLRDSGIEIARRTVAKYREGMNIPSSVQRRRMKRAYA